MNQPVLVDTCGWIEYVADGPLAEQFATSLEAVTDIVVPTVVQFELYKWFCRERDEATALDILALTELGHVVPLSSSIAISAAELATKHRLAMADAIIYTSAQHQRVPLVTSDRHFADLPGVLYYPKAGSGSGLGSA